MERLVTTAEIFTTVVEELKRKNLLPSILEYCELTMEECPVLDCWFGTANQLDYGLSGGIYLT